MKITAELYFRSAATIHLAHSQYGTREKFPIDPQISFSCTCTLIEISDGNSILFC